jgi:hypothetical protein
MDKRDDFSERFVVHFLMPESLVKRLVRQHHNLTDVWGFDKFKGALWP